MSAMEVICIQDVAFYALMDKVMEHVREKYGIKEDKWISGKEAMKRLGITSRTTLSKLRDKGNIRFSQPEMGPILYDTDSIDEYLNKHANNKF